ncbi:hypothetical protein [Ornithinicoccus halotolerans]|uniref:hypothetical protein n=1 Tax=Ornithinicoccus halotolerans TaxID=1748220 RepID=UPI001294F5F0|nr:hypothetical protein [Ornithinicoccus halotolerans]
MKLLHMRRRTAAALGAALAAGAVVAATVAGGAMVDEPGSPSAPFPGGGGATHLMLE